MMKILKSMLAGATIISFGIGIIGAMMYAETRDVGVLYWSIAMFTISGANIAYVLNDEKKQITK